MTQRFATLGALLFAMIASNIFIITISLPFKGTWVITGGILFASVCLLLWDYNKLRYLFLPDNFTAWPNFTGLPAAGWVWQLAGLLLFAASVLLSILAGGNVL